MGWPSWDDVKSAGSKLVDAVNPVDEIIDGGKALLDGDLLGVVKAGVDAATPIDEIIGAGNDLLGHPFSGGLSNNGGVQQADPAPLPDAQAASLLPPPPPQPAPSMFGPEGEVDVKTSYLRKDARLWDAAESSYSSIESAAAGLDIETSAFSFIGGRRRAPTRPSRRRWSSCWAPHLRRTPASPTRSV
ncbi:hypothetical protein [Microbacterium suwonense]|uniref:Uncharacterized protein n=1 Tax=Microbacterium suwonense TaxID=683047 RepID=A0ABM8FV80_9MICO|nr:hypothetical protein [Microbacterium suwonense]BDZ39595.1 hypothetical protein GCM10025863_22090 [Microbacterium suwonense]